MKYRRINDQYDLAAVEFVKVEENVIHNKFTVVSDFENGVDGDLKSKESDKFRIAVEEMF